ncbi:hypothetical protein PSP6_460024 [Paraburkholderia tropica]|nr:hypothetical protein PSP6_460024 [Paraburkholderia tropica]
MLLAVLYVDMDGRVRLCAAQPVHVDARSVPIAIRGRFRRRASARAGPPRRARAYARLRGRTAPENDDEDDSKEGEGGGAAALRRNGAAWRGRVAQKRNSAREAARKTVRKTRRKARGIAAREARML